MGLEPRGVKSYYTFCCEMYTLSNGVLEGNINGQVANWLHLFGFLAVCMYSILWKCKLEGQCKKTYM